MPNIVAFLSYVFIVTFTPGPNNIMSMNNANRDGIKATLNFMLGIFFGFIVIMLLSNYFNLFLFNIMPKIKPFMKILGFGYMSYLAYKIIKSTYKNDAKADLNNFRTGILMQFLNFKVILYGITVSSNFIIPYYDSHLALFGFSIFLAMMAFASILSWASFGYFFQKFLQKYQKQFNLTMGILLFYSAIKIVI